MWTVQTKDIKVRLFNYNGWEEWADFGSSGVHKQYTIISLSAPRYKWEKVQLKVGNRFINKYRFSHSHDFCFLLDIVM